MVVQTKRIRILFVLFLLKYIFLDETDAFAVLEPLPTSGRFHDTRTTSTTTTKVPRLFDRSTVVRRSSDQFSGFESADGEGNNNKNDYSDFDEPDEISDDELLAMAGDWDDTVAPYNSIHLTGRIGGDPVARYFDDGKVVVNVNLAVQRKYVFTERAAMEIGFGEEETDWFGLEVWGPQAEFVARYVEKGARVGVVGTLEIDEWNDRETGEIRSRAKIIVRDLDILETKAEAVARRSRTGGEGGGRYGGAGRGGGDGYGFNPAGSGGFFD